MSLKPGTRCVIVAGCPENIGVIVDVIGPVTPSSPHEEAYWIQTVSGRPFHQLWEGNDLLRGDSNRAITDRYKLRPLVFPMNKGYVHYEVESNLGLHKTDYLLNRESNSNGRTTLIVTLPNAG